MNKRKSVTIAQYEPLVTPAKWAEDEKRFAHRLTQLMDELFARQAALNRRVAALEAKKE